MNTLSDESTPGPGRLYEIGRVRRPAAPAPADPRMTSRDVDLLVEITQAAKLMAVGALTFGLTMMVCWPLRHQESIFAAIAAL